MLLNKNKTVLITGAARRLGAAMSMHLASEGWHVVVHCNHSQREAHALCRSIEAQYGISAFTVCGDLADPAQSGRVFASALTAAGRIDALINNASIFSVNPLETALPEEYARYNQINALAPIALTRLFAGHIRERDSRGSVINILDQRINDPLTATTPYVLSKRTLAAYTVAAAGELAPRIRVNAVAPGAILPPVHEEGRELSGTFLVDHRPTPQDVAQAVTYLLAAESVTGQTLYIDSGQHLIRLG